MALTVDVVKQTVFGDMKVSIVDVTPDNAWLAAGEALTAAQCGLSSITTALIEQVGGIVWRYDYTNSLLLAYYADYSSATDGALIAVANDVDLDANTVRITVIGQ